MLSYLKLVLNKESINQKIKNSMKKIKLPKEDRNAWLEALRSGEYKQGKNRLHGNDGYCCLGVICKLKGIDEDEMGDIGYPNGLPLIHRDKLPEVITMDWSSSFKEIFRSRPEDEITPGYEEFMTYLGLLNDDFDMSFEEIADEIELLTEGV